jgi:Gram-negative bacterial TonB protein C-terminal
MCVGHRRWCAGAVELRGRCSTEKLIRCCALLVTAAIVRPPSLSACSPVGPVVPEGVVASAELIVRATALGYARTPADLNVRTTGTPDSLVHFRIDEVVKGEHALAYLDLPGYLSTADDFNDRPVPYDFVRPGGRAGSCFANTYRERAEFLLLLKLRDTGYTVDWYALGPTNEQLHAADDPWLEWVRAQVRAPADVVERVRRPALLNRVEPVCLTRRNCTPAVIEALIGKGGSVRDVRVVEGENSVCAEAAIAALSKWKYTPARLNGQPVDVVVQYRVAGCRITEAATPWVGRFVDLPVIH